MICVFLKSTVVSANADDISSQEKSIAVGYTFPVKPGTSEWNELIDHTQMVEACQIPEGLLHNMTTDELIETVLNYPLLMEIYTYDTFKKVLMQYQQILTDLRNYCKERMQPVNYLTNTKKLM